MIFQRYLKRMVVLGILGAIGVGLASFIINQATDSTSAEWFSLYLQFLSVVILGGIILGILWIEVLRGNGQNSGVDPIVLRYIEEELIALREEIRRTADQNDNLNTALAPILAQLDTIESSITGLEDLIQDR